MTSSFRNGQKYETLTVVLNTGIYYIVDSVTMPNIKLSNMEIKNLRFVADGTPFDVANLVFSPYHL